METERFRKMINSRFLRSIKSKILFIFYLLVADYIMHLLFILLVPLPGKFTLHHFKKKLATKKKTWNNANRSCKKNHGFLCLLKNLQCWISPEILCQQFRKTVMRSFPQTSAVIYSSIEISCRTQLTHFLNMKKNRW